MLSPLPRHSGWAHYFAHSPCRISLPRYGSRVGLCIVLFEACSAFTRVTACTLAPSPIRDALSEGFSHFVTSIAAPVASGWSGCRVGLAPTGKRRLSTAHANCGPEQLQHSCSQTRPMWPGVGFVHNGSGTIQTSTLLRSSRNGSIMARCGAKVHFRSQGG